jgi:seryl-tRNA synthetase
MSTTRENLAFAKNKANQLQQTVASRSISPAMQQAIQRATAERDSANAELVSVKAQMAAMRAQLEAIEKHSSAVSATVPAATAAAAVPVSTVDNQAIRIAPHPRTHHHQHAPAKTSLILSQSTPGACNVGASESVQVPDAVNQSVRAFLLQQQSRSCI